MAQHDFLLNADAVVNVDVNRDDGNEKSNIQCEDEVFQSFSYKRRGFERVCTFNLCFNKKVKPKSFRCFYHFFFLVESHLIENNRKSNYVMIELKLFCILIVKHMLSKIHVHNIVGLRNKSLCIREKLLKVLP